LTCRSANERERQEADAEHRLSRVRAPGPEQKLKEAVIEVTADLEEHNKIVQLYKPARLRAEQGNAPKLRMILEDPSSKDVRDGKAYGRFHEPVARNDVGAVYAQVDENFKKSAAVVISDDGARTFVPCDHPLYLPMMYPLLHLRGDHGYHRGLHYKCTPTKANKRGIRRVTARAYNNFQLYQRTEIPGAAVTADRTTPLPQLFGGKLYKQYLCESYLIEVQGNLEGQLAKPQMVGVAQQNVLDDHVGDVSDVIAPTYMSPSYVGSDKWYEHKCKDAIALQMAHGHPTYFITTTMDPNAAEVALLLEPGQTPNDRPEVLARVFKMRLAQLESDLLDTGILGKAVTYIRVVEYQKRGLPHA